MTPTQEELERLLGEMREIKKADEEEARRQEEKTRARLLSAAPDLLEACAHGVSCPICNGQGKQIDLEEMKMQKCLYCDGKGKLWSPEQLAALAKAEGEEG